MCGIIGYIKNNQYNNAFDNEEYQKAIDWAKSNGYDAVKLPLEGETRIINPDIIKTKSQLEEIWKKANSKTNKK